MLLTVCERHVVTRFILVVIWGLFLAPMGSASAQLCEELPLCPDTGATPQGDFLPNCGCPVPFDCQERFDHYVCFFDRFFFNWSCECRRPDREPIEPFDHTPEPFAPPDGFCSGMVCPDGSQPRSDGIHCLCSAPNFATPNVRPGPRQSFDPLCQSRKSSAVELLRPRTPSPRPACVSVSSAANTRTGLVPVPP